MTFIIKGKKKMRRSEVEKNSQLAAALINFLLIKIIAQKLSFTKTGMQLKTYGIHNYSIII